MEGTAAVPRSNRQWGRSFLISVILHAAALWLIATGQPGVSGGVPGGRLYAFNYMGVISGGEPAPEVKRTSGSAPVRRPSTVQPVKSAKPAKPASGQVLTATRGKETVPVQPKPPEDAGEKVETTPAAGAPRPPKGSSMVAALPQIVYPKAAQNVGIQGTVGLRVTVGPDGKPVRVEVERPSGERALDEYARRAVEREFSANAWVSTYVIHLEAHFAGGSSELRVLDEPVEVGG